LEDFGSSKPYLIKYEGGQKGGHEIYEFHNLLILNVFYLKSGARGRTRTTDTRIFNPLLYQL